MDCRRTFAAFLSAALVGSAGGSALPPEARWTTSGREVSHLTSQPAECLTLPSGREARALVALGRLAFRTPVLLGGQAARAGLSCASCHRNGRGNADFHFPGLSGASGTADVTSSLMSRTRGDGQFNPVTIPDLARDVPKVADAALETFVRGLVVEEFDGPVPAPRVLAGLLAYRRTLGQCQAADAISRVTLECDIGETILAVSVVEAEVTRGDDAVTRFAILGLRNMIGRIAARFAPFPQEVAALVALDRKLARPVTAPTLRKWLKDFERLVPILRRESARSYYSPSVISAATALTGQDPVGSRRF